MSNTGIRKRAVGAIVVMVSFALIAIWQFYVFVTFTNPQGAVDLQGGRLHLLAAIGSALIACVAAFLCFSVFLRYDTTRELHITS